MHDLLREMARREEATGEGREHSSPWCRSGPSEGEREGREVRGGLSPQHMLSLGRLSTSVQAAKQNILK